MKSAPRLRASYLPQPAPPAWVNFLCSARDCEARLTFCALPRREAVQCAADAGWTIYAGHALCPECSAREDGGR
jgi:hypothetical protein